MCRWQGPKREGAPALESALQRLRKFISKCRCLRHCRKLTVAGINDVVVGTLFTAWLTRRCQVRGLGT